MVVVLIRVKTLENPDGTHQVIAGFWLDGDSPSQRLSQNFPKPPKIIYVHGEFSTINQPFWGDAHGHGNPDLGVTGIMPGLAGVQGLIYLSTTNHWASLVSQGHDKRLKPRLGVFGTPQITFLFKESSHGFRKSWISHGENSPFIFLIQQIKDERGLLQDS